MKNILESVFDPPKVCLTHQKCEEHSELHAIAELMRAKIFMTYLAELVRVKFFSVVPRGTREGEIFSDVSLQKNLATVSQDLQSLTMSLTDFVYS